MLAALRIAGYELAWSEAPGHAVVNDAVELVREAGLAHATGFTNAVARRLAEGFPALVAALPPGPLAESYPDWIYAIWVRDFGEDEALALMRAQNEPAELVVRSAVPVGEPTDVPGAYRLERGDARGPAGRTRSGRAAARSSPRSRSARATASGSSTPAPRPGAKATMLHGEVTAVELHPGRARELEENVRRLGVANVRVVNADVRELERVGLRPRARRRAVLGPRRARPPARPALARDPAPGPPARADPRRRRAHEARRHASSTRSAR